MSAGHFITTVRDVEYPNNARSACYAFCRIDDEQLIGAAVSIRRAIELQTEGVEYRPLGLPTPAAFDTWFGPDFPQVGKVMDNLVAAVDATR